MKFVTLGPSIAELVGACDQPRTELPPPPVIAPGEGFANASSFDSDHMMRMCEQTNLVADAGNLRTFNDAQVANGTCMMSAIAVVMISRGDDPDQRCVAATATMISEFKRRFPDHEASEVVGRC